MPAMSSRGFTLIEAMIVVTVLAIVAAIAIPSYGSYVIRANRAAAKAAVMRIAGQQESFYTDRKRYATNLGNLGLGAATVYLSRDGNFQAVDDAEAIYAVRLAPGATSAVFTIEAAPVHSQARDKDCATLRYTSTGLKSASTGRTDCWSR